MKGFAYLDRGSVLFVGIVVGAFLTMSFQTDGKPFARLIAAETSRAPIPPPPAAKGCTSDFPFTSRVLARIRANQPLRIGVFGDSFGDGLSEATSQTFHGNPNVQVFQFSREATGFTRYQSHDLLQEAKAKLAEQPIDIALIDVGANDTQGVWLGGKGAAYMSASWQKIIGGRATDLVDYLHGAGVTVGWVGLPRMRDDQYDRDVQAMNAFYASLMCSLHVPFVDPVAVSEDGQHRFAMTLTDPATKQPYPARAPDGVHMSMHGYRVIAKPLLDRIDMLSGDGTRPAAKGT